jgi:outer membrane protein
MLKLFQLNYRILIIFLFVFSNVQSQTLLNLETAMDYAGKNSPDIQRSLLNLQRAQESLNAQRASLKSQLSLSLNPLIYNNRRQFNEPFSRWYNNESFNTNGVSAN